MIGVTIEALKAGGSRRPAKISPALRQQGLRGLLGKQKITAFPYRITIGMKDIPFRKV